MSAEIYHIKLRIDKDEQRKKEEIKRLQEMQELLSIVYDNAEEMNLKFAGYLVGMGIHEITDQIAERQAS